MSQVYCIGRRTKDKHLTYEDREELASRLEQNKIGGYLNSLDSLITFISVS